MSRSARPEALAARLRQAVQGCTLHPNGPVQAWQAIEDAVLSGEVAAADVARLAAEACDARIEELQRQGAAEGDPRLRKEEIARRFIRRLFR